MRVFKTSSISSCDMKGNSSFLFLPVVAINNIHWENIPFSIAAITLWHETLESLEVQTPYKKCIINNGKKVEFYTYEKLTKISLLIT